MSQEACDTFTKFLADHTIVTILVAPNRCKGLDDFPADAPLRLDLSHAFQPPMWPAVTPYGLDFHASFAGRVRPVSVPWSALLWAGIPQTGGPNKPTQAQVTATPTPAATPQIREGKLIHGNFGKRVASKDPA
jgi:hypothetical protein